MNSNKTAVIWDWPEPWTVKDLQSFLGFANFYRQFISDYSSITAPLTWLLRKDTPWLFSDKCSTAFQQLKDAFVTAPVLAHFNPEYPSVLETDASDFAVAAILSQLNPEMKLVHPIAFHSQTMHTAELNYEIHDKELLAIYEAFTHWRAYLEGTPHSTLVLTDHRNLVYFASSKQLNRRQARWSEYLAGFDFIIRYQIDKLNLVDISSR